ncbi:MAG: magnesium chelatase, partial [Ignavibacteriales bacterium]|nr:magnesium chelatase [Ignavibacteriales bacterium]
VMCAREIQMNRFTKRKGMYSNADMQSKDIQTYCKLDCIGEDLLKIAITKLGLSGRAYERALELTQQEPERRFLEKRLGELVG